MQINNTLNGALNMKVKLLATILFVLMLCCFFIFQFQTSNAMNNYDSTSYSDIQGFRTFFISQHPVDTSEAEIDKKLITELGFIKSKKWYLSKTEKKIKGFIYNLGEAEDHYYITYYKSQGTFKSVVGESYEIKPLGYFFTLKYSIKGELLDVKSKGLAKTSKAPNDLLLNYIFEEGELL